MVKYREPSVADSVQTLIIIVIFVAGIITLIYLTMPDNPIVGYVMVAGCLFLLVRWHSRTFGYRCLRCGNEFGISIWQDLISFHGPGKDGGWTYLKCQNCGKYSRAHILTRV